MQASQNKNYLKNINIADGPFFSFSAISTMLGIFLISMSVHAELYFAPTLISDKPEMVADMTRLQKDGAQLPGNYQVEIYINGTQADSKSMIFNEASSPTTNIEVHDKTGLMACLTRRDLEELGVNVQPIPLDPENDEKCISPGEFIPDAFTAFDFQKMRLDVSVPQAAMSTSARGYIPPARWDDGINAFILNYSYSGSQNKGNGGETESNYLNLNGGVNWGPWRLRDNRIWNEYDSKHYSSRKWQHVNTYVQRAIVPFRSNLTIGDGSSDGDIFDSLSFRGIQIASDENMYPDSMRGFAPIVRGVANTNARVNIRQNGYSVYETFVSPGAFTIEDLYPQFTSGDLEVTITEADGSVRVFTVPYSSLPVLQREGRMKYSLTTGQYRSSSHSYSKPGFVEGTVTRGFQHNITGYGGLQYSENYFAGLLGVGLNLGALGAFSADITHANSTLTDGSSHNGQSLRFLYARTLNTIGTTFQLTGYRYSTEGFHTLDETALKGMKGWRFETDTTDAAGKPVARPFNDYYNLYNNKRSKIQVSVSQRVTDIGSLYVSGLRQSYWNTEGYTDSLQTGFNGNFAKVNYGLTYSHSRQGSQSRADNSLLLSLSVPLDVVFKNSSSMYATYAASRNREGEISHQAGLSGSALEDKNLTWNLVQGNTRTEGNSGSFGANYSGGSGNGNLGYSYSNSYRQTNYGVSGSALLHEEGVTLGQPMGDTSVLIAAPGTSDVKIENEVGVRTDWRGYTIKPNATAYRENRIALDTISMDDNTDFDSAVTQVVPTRGAIVKAGFKGYKGSRVLMTLTNNGKPLPFGTMANAGERVGIVGDDGQVYFSGMPAEGIVRAEWGALAGEQCSISYRLPAAAMDMSLVRIAADCH